MVDNVGKKIDSAEELKNFFNQKDRKGRLVLKGGELFSKELRWYHVLGAKLGFGGAALRRIVAFAEKKEWDTSPLTAAVDKHNKKFFKRKITLATMKHTVPEEQKKFIEKQFTDRSLSNSVSSNKGKSSSRTLYQAPQKNIKNEQTEKSTNISTSKPIQATLSQKPAPQQSILEKKKQKAQNDIEWKVRQELLPYLNRKKIPSDARKPLLEILKAELSNQGSSEIFTDREIEIIACKEYLKMGMGYYKVKSGEEKNQFRSAFLEAAKKDFSTEFLSDTEGLNKIFIEVGLDPMLEEQTHSQPSSHTHIQQPSIQPPPEKPPTHTPLPSIHIQQSENLPPLDSNNIGQLINEYMSQDVMNVRSHGAAILFVKEQCTVSSEQEQLITQAYDAYFQNLIKSAQSSTKIVEPPQQVQKSSYAENLTQLGIGNIEDPKSIWTFFWSKDSSFSSDVMGYDKARKQWKVFFNPKKEHFESVLHRIIQRCEKEEIPFTGKIVKSPEIQRGSNQPMIDDPCEPKMLFYFSAESSETSKEQLRKFIEVIEKEFSQEEINTFGCEEGKREKWVEDKNRPNTYSKQSAPQSGPSFTKQRNKLIFYSQGGFTESGRDQFVRGSFNKQGMEKKFEGDNYYLYKGEVDPFASQHPKNQEGIKTPKNIDQPTTPIPEGQSTQTLSVAKERLQRFAENQLELHTKAKTNQQLRNRLFNASYTHKVAHAEIMLREKNPTDEEIAACSNMSIHTLRSQRIADCYLSLCLEQKSVIEFSSKQIAEKLGVDEQTINQWLENSERLVEIQSSFTKLGTQFDTLTRQSINTQSLDEKQAKELLHEVEILFQYVEKNVDSFSQPLSILKLFSLSQNLSVINQKNGYSQELSELSVKLQEKSQELLGTTIQQMELHRKGSVWKMMQAKSTPEELRKIISSHTWGIGNNSGPKATEEPRSFASIDIAKNVLENAKKLKTELENKKGKGGALATKISDIDNFYNDASDDQKALEILISKVDNVIKRQETRIEKFEKGEPISIPLMFHAAPKEDVLFQITSSEIRYSNSSYTAAFVSTNPAMLRYGGAVLGLGSESAFSSPLEKTFNDISILLPGKLSAFGFNKDVLRDTKSEQWIGFSESVTINPKVQEVEQQFFASLQEHFLDYISKAHPEIPLDSKELHLVIAQTITDLRNEKLTFTFTEKIIQEKKVAVWTPFIFKSGKYEELNALKLYAKIEENFSSKFPNVSATQGGFASNNLLRNLDSLCSIQKNRYTAPIPYFIGFDSESEVQNHFQGDWQWRNRSSAKQSDTSIESIQKKALEQLPKSFTERELALLEKKRKNPQCETTGWSTSEIQKVQQFIEEVNMHCIPMMEQVIEFGLITQHIGGSLLLKEWLK